MIHTTPSLRWTTNLPNNDRGVGWEEEHHDDDDERLPDNLEDLPWFSMHTAPQHSHYDDDDDPFPMGIQVHVLWDQMEAAAVAAAATRSSTTASISCLAKDRFGGMHIKDDDDDATLPPSDMEDSDHAEDDDDESFVWDATVDTSAKFWSASSRLDGTEGLSPPQRTILPFGGHHPS